MLGCTLGIFKYSMKFAIAGIFWYLAAIAYVVLVPKPDELCPSSATVRVERI